MLAAHAVVPTGVCDAVWDADAVWLLEPV